MAGMMRPARQTSSMLMAIVTAQKLWLKLKPSGCKMMFRVAVGFNMLIRPRPL